MEEKEGDYVETAKVCAVENNSNSNSNEML